MRSLLILICCCIMPIFAAELYPFADDQQRQRFQHLTQQFRCLVCQNEDLASSTAELAQDLRQQIYQQLSEGKTDGQITDYLVNRYSGFILFRPPLQPQTLLLWFGPVAFFIIGLGVWWIIIRRARATSHVGA